MSIPDDADPDALISRLAGSLAPSDRAAFRSAAEAAIEQISCPGEGLIYRIVSAVWRSYFHPADTRYDSRRDDVRNNKLTSAPPIGADDPRTGGRDRRRLKLVG